MSETKKTGLELLREPFPPHQISKLPKPYKKDSPKGNCDVCGGYHGLPAVHLDYVGHAALTDRLLDADPNWTWEPVAFGDDGLPKFDPSGGLWIRLTVCGVTRLGYGNAEGKSYMDVGSRDKEVIGDALRNAAMRFGAALDLWHKGDLHGIEEEPQKPRKESSKSVAQVQWEETDPENQTFLREVADKVKLLISEGDVPSAVGHLEAQKFDSDDKTAIWYLFDSKQRAAIKKFQEETK